MHFNGFFVDSITIKINIMKSLLSIFFILLLVNCSQKKEIKMNGAYSMQSQVLNDGSKDTSINRKQLKIYTKDHVIYAAMRFPDSLASYGIGTYDIVDGNVIEHLFYTSANGNKKDTFSLAIDKSDKGYKQIIADLPSQGKMYKLTEEYENVGKGDSTALDGAWKQTTNFYIDRKGDTSSNPNVTEFKVYQNGQFIWAASYPDSTKKLLTFFGFGKFEMDGNTKSKEVNALSTYPPLIDTTMHVELEFMGNDSYKQTIIQKDSSRSIEIYERMKKD